jgi:ABC-type uncharacterized transport system involved in gliding motility auxiliary subunit
MAEATKVQATNQRRRAIAGIVASASTLLVLAIVLMANYLSFRHYQRFDWTAQGIFTLSPKSKQVLRELNRDVDVYVFISRGEGSFASTDELLKRYAALSSHVLLHYVDPDREAGQFKLLAQRFGVAAGVLETGEARADVAIVVALGDKNWHVNRDDLVGSELGGQPGEGQAGEEVQLKGEQAFTGAIVQVTSGRATKICLTSGHGEWTLTEGERSLASLEHALRHDNLEWKPFETLGQKIVPSECDAVLVAGPVHAFSEAEAKLVLDYARNGGNVLLALDPVIEHDQISSTGFEAPLREAGIRLDPALVLELNKERLLTRNPAEFVVTEFGDHVTTRPMQHNARVFLSLVRGVTPIGQDGQVEILLRTSDEGFGKTDIADLKPDQEPVKGAADIAGPVSIAVATQFNPPSPGTKKTGGRLIVIGDTDFMVSQLLDTPELQNFQLASAFLGWVAERPALIEIPPKKIKSGNIVFSQDDLWSLFFRVAVLVPAAALILGVAVWLNRRA